MPFLKTFFSCPGVPAQIRFKNVAIEASTLGEAINAAERLANVRIVAHDPPKWFRVYAPEPDSLDYRLVDIHVHRGDIDICPKQNLGYALLPEDIILIAGLVC